MSKTRFVQNVIIRSLPRLERIEAGVRYAEQVYDELTRLGYGAPKQRKTRDSIDHYNELTGTQRAWFDQFWVAFNHKAGRNRAALAWSKLGELSELEYRTIVDAARAEALTPRKPTESRKMAEGWLTERRFEDRAAGKAQRQIDKTRERRILLNSQLNALKQFNSDGSQDNAIAAIEAEIATL